MILLIDNYDSFVHNVARHLERLGQRTVVFRNDAIDVEKVRDMKPGAIVISPGPCTPGEAGRSGEIVSRLFEEFAMLGICLGHQTIAASFGASIVRAAEPVHGRVSEVRHDGQGIFHGASDPLTVCRYHSLVVDETTLPDCLEVTARSGSIPMAIRHRRLPIVGLQFHPESILTQDGYLMLANFLRLAGLPVPDELPRAEFEPHGKNPRPILPDVPVTF